jgi:hypothetical protein
MDNTGGHMFQCQWCQRGRLIGTISCSCTTYKHFEIRIKFRHYESFGFTSELLRNTAHKHKLAEAVVLLE